MNRKIVYMIVYVSVCFVFPSLPIKGFQFIAKCLGGLIGGMASEMPIPFNPFK